MTPEYVRDLLSKGETSSIQFKSNITNEHSIAQEMRLRYNQPYFLIFPITREAKLGLSPVSVKSSSLALLTLSIV